MEPEVAGAGVRAVLSRPGSGGERSGLGLSQVYGESQAVRRLARNRQRRRARTTVQLLLPCSAGLERGRSITARGDAQMPRSGEIDPLVEDTPLVRQRGGAGWSAISAIASIAAADADEALRLIEGDTQARIDLFTDMVLPGALCGEELAVIARRLRPGLGVLYTSGYSEVRTCRTLAGSRAVVSGFIGKPYSRAELAVELRMPARRPRQPRSKPRSPAGACIIWRSRIIFCINLTVQGRYGRRLRCCGAAQPSHRQGG